MFNKNILVCLVFLIAFVNCERLINNSLFLKIQEKLSKYNEDNAPEALKQMIRNKRDEGDNSHWCCKINVPPLAIERTRLVSWAQVMSASHLCGYSSCGVFGWSSCANYCMQYWTETQYHAETYTVYEEQKCPLDQLTCCKDHLYVLGHCFSFEEISSNLDLLAQLQQEGLVIPGLPIGK